MKTLKLRLVRIGNSQGIRIPKLIIDQVGLGEEVELDVKKDRLVVRATTKPRAGWADKFREMAEQGDDRLLDPPMATTWDESEWEW